MKIPQELIKELVQSKDFKNTGDIIGDIDAKLDELQNELLSLQVWQ